MQTTLLLLSALLTAPLLTHSQVVGIGTNTPDPDRTLTVKGTGDDSELISLQNKNDQTKWHWNMRNGGLNLAETGVADGRLFVKPGGNVGIGTTTPEDKLDVHGDVRFRNQVKMGYLYVERKESLGPTVLQNYDVFCPRGYRVIGGGGGHELVNGAASSIQTLYNGPMPSPEYAEIAWRVYLWNRDNTSGRGVIAYCICARIAN